MTRPNIFDYQHILWDWNGTLLNDTPLTHQILVETVRQVTKAEVPNFEQWRNTIYSPMRSYYRGLLGDVSEEVVSSVMREWALRYETRMESCELQPGAKKLLSLLSSRGIHQSILSAHTAPELARAVASHNLHPHFVEICGLAPGQGGGSKVKLGAALLRRLEVSHNLSSSAHLIIGDSNNDADVARELGIACILVANGLCPESMLRSTGFPVIASLSELVP